jgi:HEAT repeat protein
MKLNEWISTRNDKTSQAWWLRLLNLRLEESERTFLMFLFYTATSVGILWLEVSVAALFLGKYGASSLPLIYIASALIGAGLGLLTDGLQRFISLRRVIVLISILMAVPLIFFRVGIQHPALFWGYSVFLIRLWLEAIYVLNEVTTSITANQLFTIREIKRTYPLISSGILVADVLSGFSLPFLRQLVGLENIILMSCFMLLAGAGVLFYISQSYRQFFPDSPRKLLLDEEIDPANRRLRGPVRSYVLLVIAFFILSQVLFLLVDFQYLSQLDFRFLNGATGVAAEENLNRVADFLALFSATLGVFELLTQWFVSSRAIERLGVFTIAMLPPILISALGLPLLVGLFQFWGAVTLKFLDELLRYTVIASIGPILFQPIPEESRSRYQSIVRGVAEPLSAGAIGLVMWFTIGILPNFQQQNRVFMLYITVFAIAWVWVVFTTRSRYLNLLVVSAEKGHLSLAEVDLRDLKRAVMEALERPGNEADKSSCIELLTHIDPKSVGEVLSPILPNVSPKLQGQVLRSMLNYPNPAYLPQIRALIEQPLTAEVFAAALRYIWITDPAPDMKELRPYLRPDVDAVIRGTAAAMLLRRGNPHEKAAATDVLRRMLMNEQERERVMGCRALGEATYLQALRIYIEPLLQDDSLRVRCALLEAIAATHLEEYYPCLIQGLHYKSTREAATQALVRLENEALPMLLKLAEDPFKPELIKTHAWNTIGQIGTPEAIDLLVMNMTTAWGPTRRSILRSLFKIPHEAGIEAVLNTLGRNGVELLINQELLFIAQNSASLMDLSEEKVIGGEADLLRRALQDQEKDAIDRIFLFMRFLYSPNAIQAAEFNLQSGSREGVPRGLEILDNTIDISGKRVLLNLLDQQSHTEKLQNLSEILPYEPMSPSQRLRFLLDLRIFLSDWALACCFHLARQYRWSLTPDQTLSSLRHPVGFVREAVISYLRIASPGTLREILSALKADPDRLVAAQVQSLLAEMELSPAAGTFQQNNGVVQFN